MNKIYRLIIVLFCLSLISVCVHAQTVSAPGNDTANVLISSVKISGNRHTKDYIILREMPFKAGDRLSKKDLPENFLLAANQVRNTNLFAELRIDSSVNADSSLQVNISVRERYYIYPTPQFQLVDRSFNEWVKTYHADFNRVVYGVKFAHYNLTGRRDQLRIYLLNGYARNFSASYVSPLLDSALTKGFGAAAGFTQNREVGYKTTYFNKTLNYKKDDFVRNSFNASFAYSIRKGLFKSTSFAFGINYINADDSLLTQKYNPHYFNSSKHTQVFPDFSAGISYAKTDNINYPLKGKIWGVSFSKRGLAFKGGINNTILQGTASIFIPHRHNWYSSIQASGIIKVPFDEAYINQRAIGYGNLTLRGLEYYVADGVVAALAKYTLSKKIAEFKVKTPIHIKKLPYIPFKFFAKTYADAGYSYNQSKYETRLNNRFCIPAVSELMCLLYTILFLRWSTVLTN